jgi:flagellar biosynthesis/type III secretory pathway M-ring protein FliF/YscJ
MKEDSLVKLFVRNLVMAIPWGIIFLVIFLIASVGIKQQIKESMQFATRIAISEISNRLLDYPVFIRIKQNTKESIEFSAKTLRNELKDLLNDPQVKENLKEILESSPER